VTEAGRGNTAIDPEQNHQQRFELTYGEHACRIRCNNGGDAELQVRNLLKSYRIADDVFLCRRPKLNASMMRACFINFRKKLLDGKATYLGCSVNSSSTLVAELVASQGYDFVMVDAQHSALDVEHLRSILQAVKAGGCRSMVRVGGHTDR